MYLRVSLSLCLLAKQSHRDPSSKEDQFKSLYIQHTVCVISCLLQQLHKPLCFYMFSMFVGTYISSSPEILQREREATNKRGEDHTDGRRGEVSEHWKQ